MPQYYISEEAQRSKCLEAPPDFTGPAKRKCTDVLFLILIVALWAGMTYIGYDAVKNGDPEELINGIDYAGQICGVSPTVANESNFYYVRFDGVGVCVEDCPNETDFNTLYACIGTDSQYALGGENQLNCLGADASQCQELTGISDVTTFEGTGNGTCMYQIESIDVLNRCLYTISYISDDFTSLEDEYTFAQQALADIYTARNWILGFGFLLTFALGFLYCFMLRIPGLISFLIWGCALLVLGLLISLGFVTYFFAADWLSEETNFHSDSQVTFARIVGIIFFVFSALFACFLIFMFRRVRLATRIMKEAARAILSVPAMVLMPIIEALGIVLFCIPVVFYGVYVASLGDVTMELDDGYIVRSVDFSDDVWYRFFYLLFSFYWTTNFVIGVGQIIIALTIVTYYFTRDKSTIGMMTFFRSLGLGVIYHMGTAALGGLAISILSFIRTLLIYVEQKSRLAQNKVLQLIASCCACCFWCLEKCMKFISKEAYIQTALFSTSFCKSAREAFFLISRNILRVGAVHIVNEFMNVVMKLAICLSVTALTYLCLTRTMDDQLYSVVTPTIFAGLLAYTVSTVFSELFSMTTSTLLHCYVADSEMFEVHGRHSVKHMDEFIIYCAESDEPKDKKKHAFVSGT